MSKLLIVESPAKARTIGRMLGKDYRVVASMGHIRDLPEREFGVDIAHGFAPVYVDTPRSKSVVRELRAAAKKADEIYLAPDPDREGEAIAWHLHEVLADGTKSPFYRVTFHEITRGAIERALGEKGGINLDLVDAQQARRVLDRIVGYQVSPLLWSRIGKGCSAGRVQSAALRLVVERERAIRQFQPQEYWVFEAEFETGDGRRFRARLFKIDAKEFRIGSGAEASALLEAVRSGGAPRVVSVAASDRRRGAPPPFTTSTLQQSANVSLHYTATSTMRYAQHLYEGVDIGKGGTVGLITYMRTDSVTIAKEAQTAAAAFIAEHYGREYVPARPNFFRSKAAAQEAHEAIRPTDVRRTPELMAPYLEPQELKLYTLIWRRFVASQMTPAVQKLTTVDVAVDGAPGTGEYLFRATAAVPVFPGFSKVFEDSARQKDESAAAAVLGSLRENDALKFRDLKEEQKFTEPPPRFSEAALIKELEENGIGRPSTYATILRTIQDRDYVRREQGRLLPTDLGFAVNDFLVERLPELFDIGFTARMERQLDEIEEGKVGWVAAMKEFYDRFEPWLAGAKEADLLSVEAAEPLLSLFDGVTFDPPQKVGRRVYDDGRFVRSVREAFDAGKKVSPRQYQALLMLAARYASRMAPDRRAGLPESLRAELERVEREHAEREERRDAAQAASAEVDYAGLFAAFDKVTFEPPSKKGRFAYDDRKFFTSLRNQALSGRALSEKQLAALAKMASKYRGELTEPEKVDAMLASARGGAAETGASAPESADAARLLEGLSRVTQWAEPVKKGRFTYDDREFFESLARRHSAGGRLSIKQQAALAKMAAKYGVK